MPWTDPASWAVSELVTAAKMNTHVRDNLNSTIHVIVRKSADESVASSTTQQNDDSLILPLGANEAWEFRFQLAVVSTAAADIAISLDAPTGATLYCCLVWADTVGTLLFHDFSGTSFPTGSKSCFVPSTLIGIPLSGTIVNGSTAGNLTLRWAQAAASGTTTVKANSTLCGVKLA